MTKSRDQKIAQKSHQKRKRKRKQNKKNSKNQVHERLLDLEGQVAEYWIVEASLTKQGGSKHKNQT